MTDGIVVLAAPPTPVLTAVCECSTRPRWSYFLYTEDGKVHQVKCPTLTVAFLSAGGVKGCPPLDGSSRVFVESLSRLRTVGNHYLDA
jgi:hypothetical protein